MQLLAAAPWRAGRNLPRRSSSRIEWLEQQLPRPAANTPAPNAAFAAVVPPPAIPRAGFDPTSIAAPRPGTSPNHGTAFTAGPPPFPLADSADLPPLPPIPSTVVPAKVPPRRRLRLLLLVAAVVLVAVGVASVIWLPGFLQTAETTDDQHQLALKTTTEKATATSSKSETKSKSESGKKPSTWPRAADRP